MDYCTYMVNSIVVSRGLLYVVIIQALIGDRYGYRPFPAKIPLEEFKFLIELAKSHNINTDILSKWYKLDHNAVNSIFQLVPITEYYPNYSSKNEELKKVDRDGWWKTFLEIQSVFWKLVDVAVGSGQMSPEKAHVYLQSGIQVTISLVLAHYVNLLNRC